MPILRAVENSTLDLTQYGRRRQFDLAKSVFGNLTLTYALNNRLWFRDLFVYL